MNRYFGIAAVPLLVTTVVASAQDRGDKDVLEFRQALTERFAAAVAQKDVAAVQAAIDNLYAPDAVIQSLCPESALAFGRDGYGKRIEAALKAGFGNYSAKVKEAHVLPNGTAWTTASYTFTVNGKDGQPEQAHGNWIDMLRREGSGWKVTFQAYARTPC